MAEVKIDERIMEIDKHLRTLEEHVRECDNDVIDDAFALGRFIGDMRENELSRLYSATGKFHRECVCGKKG